MGHTYVGARLKHVVSIPARNGYKGHSVWIVANLLNVGAHFLHNFLVALLAVVRLGGVHFVDAHDELLDSQGVGQQGMLAGLSVLGYTGLELADASCHDQHGAVGLQVGRLNIYIQRVKLSQRQGAKKVAILMLQTWEVPVIMFLIKSL